MSDYVKMKSLTKNIMPEKKYWRCTVCGDLHWGANAPELCPTCKQTEKYVEITKEEFEKLVNA